MASCAPIGNRRKIAGVKKRTQNNARYVKIELYLNRDSPIDRQSFQVFVKHGGATDSTGLNRGGEACRVPSSRKTIGKTQLPTRSLHTLLN
jgi:hypothetical protein